MDNFPGPFNVVITQDPRRILNQDHAEMEIRFALKEHIGDHAYDKVTIQRHVKPISGMVETVGSVYILSINEMDEVKRHIRDLEALVSLSRNSIFGGEF